MPDARDDTTPATGRGTACDDAADAAAFRALASPARRRVLRLVRDEARSVGELAAELGVSQPAASQHLGVLRDAGLVTVTVDGRHRRYRVDRAGIAAVRAFFDDYWSDALDRLEAAALEAAAASPDAGVGAEVA